MPAETTVLPIASYPPALTTLSPLRLSIDILMGFHGFREQNQERYRDYSGRAGVSAVCVRGEWEAELGKGRGIVVCSNGGFPSPVSQTVHVTRPDKEWDQEFRGRFREREEAEGGVNQ